MLNNKNIDVTLPKLSSTVLKDLENMYLSAKESSAEKMIHLNRQPSVGTLLSGWEVSLLFFTSYYSFRSHVTT